ncbi:protein NRT1/ PTR FAMILY 1.2-like [Rhodamnia argentea]|uniref:Protein NRT1/ PTR FAMILY 1.2-like n=1 Tax=Rhodamnia argentea TaxID=178133 RepID=A0A8B8Q3S4_9MYRT|nr:protein NRT1/ PTR FAMILY 1.2-like [Rhodamnia argentea]
MEIASDKAREAKQVTSKKGGLKTIPFIIANEILEKVAGYGLLPNMILYLIYEYRFDAASGANVLFLWLAITNFMPTLGAFLSDSCLGRFRVIGFGSIISLLGMTLLWLTALLRDAQPPPCNPRIETCKSPTWAQLLLLFSSFALMSIGAGGIRSCSMVFGADQIDNPDNPKNGRILQTFFNWYYASVGISIAIAIIMIVDIQNSRGWVVGFAVPAGLMLVSAVSFFLGSSLYVKVKANKSLFTGLAQSMVAAWKKRHLEIPSMDHDATYYHLKGSKITTPSEKLSFLNRACLINNPEKDLDADGLAVDPWRLCTIQQVEVLKALIKVLPIWSTGIIIGVTISQGAFPVLQAKTMDRHFLFGLKIPPGSFGIFSLLTLTIWVALYDRIIIPLVSKLTSRPGGLTYKERMGIGLLISCVGMFVSAAVEHRRRAEAIREGLAQNPAGVLKMSAMWIVPQHCLTGLAEAFNAIGQIEFYYSQFPKSMASIAVALLTLGMAVGNVAASLIVSILDHLSRRSRNGTWISTNVNEGHYDYYYWILAGLSVINFCYYLVCAWAYEGGEERKIWDEDGSEDDLEIDRVSPMRIHA